MQNFIEKKKKSFFFEWADKRANVIKKRMQLAII
jgi:hypothetical protein